MMPIQLTIQEQARLASVHRLAVLDTPPEERFDRIIRVSQRMFGVPISYIGFVDRDRIWCKASIGLDSPNIPIQHAFERVALQKNLLFAVPDTHLDPRFQEHPLVKEQPEVRFFAGLPLLDSEGTAVGILAILDYRPRELNEPEQIALSDLSAWAQRELRDHHVKAADENLGSSDSRMRAVLNNVRDGIITLNMKGTIESFNPAAELLFGFHSKEIIGHHFLELLADPSASIGAGEMLQSDTLRLSQHLGSGGEVIGRRRDGSEFPMELSINDMWLGQYRMFTAIARDITERKRVEEMKNEFISIVSHELRTPLTSIHGSLGLLSGGVAGELPERARAMIKIAYNNSERLVRLISDILDMEKIESGKMEFRLEPQPLLPLVQQSIEANEGFVKKFNVLLKLTQHIDGAVIVVDADRFLQVMANLLSNAAKFSAPQDIVEIVLSRHGKFIRVEVKDNGPGIPEHFQGHIFDKFTQAKEQQSRHGGSGLGLNICKQIVEKMSGTIGFQTVLGKGTTFFFDLPEKNV